MADITMCTNETCPLASGCYRKLAKRNEYWQAVSNFEYKHTENGIECNHYWSVKIRKRKGI